jgi:hypothetical protein
MLSTLQQIMEQALQRLAHPAVQFLPPLIAGLLILLGAFLIARLLRWLLASTIKLAGLDRFLVQSGLASLLGFSGRIRASRLVAGAAYWITLAIGLLTALNAFDTSLTSRMVETVILLFPKIVTAAVILLVGLWLGQYLGRSMLVWACNEGVPYPRRLAGGVRMLIVFIAVVVAADYLEFARSVFLAAFLIVVGGAVLAASIAAGLGAHTAIRRRLETQPEVEHEKTLWNHL